MKEILEFLYANPVGALATVDENSKPHVRPWEFMFEQYGKLWFWTDNTNEVFCELQCNPAIEFCSTSKDMVAVRIRGEVIFGIDLNIKRRILESNTLVKELFNTVDNPEFEIFYLKHGQATIYRHSHLIKKVIF